MSQMSNWRLLANFIKNDAITKTDGLALSPDSCLSSYNFGILFKRRYISARIDL